MGRIIHGVYKLLVCSYCVSLTSVTWCCSDYSKSHCISLFGCPAHFWQNMACSSQKTWSKSTAQTAHRVSLPLHKTPWHPHYSSAASFQAVAWKSMLQALASQGWNFLYKWKPIWNKNRPLCITTSIVHARKPIKFCFYLQCLLHSPVRWHCKLSLSPFKREL